MADYFGGLRTPEEIKTAYRKLCMRWHPDRGGDTETMKQINAAYQEALKAVDGVTSQGSDGKDHTYYYNHDIEASIMDKINEVVGLGMVQVEIMLLGRWIWITGETKRYSKLLGKKGVGFYWHSKRSAWYWHPPQKRRTRYNSRGTLDDIAASYGYRGFQSDQRKQIA